MRVHETAPEQNAHGGHCQVFPVPDYQKHPTGEFGDKSFAGVHVRVAFEVSVILMRQILGRFYINCCKDMAKSAQRLLHLQRQTRYLCLLVFVGL
jgi:hypothetical protein